MYRRAFAILISVLALAGVAAGCGGGDDSDSLTKAEFVKQASDVCLKVNKETQKNLEAAVQAQEGVPPSKKSEEQLVNNIVIPALQKQSEKLKELGAPEGEEEQVAAIIDALDKVASEAEENPVGVASQSDPFLEVDQLMKDYGIEACRH